MQKALNGNRPSGNVLAPAQLDAIRKFDTCRIANAIETFEIRLRNEGFTRPGLHCLFPELPPMLGYAVTARIRSSNPPPDRHTYPDRTDWWAMVKSGPGPRIAVIQDIGPEPGLGAAVGEVHAHILKALGCVGVVTNGAVRDLPAVEAIGFPLFACAVSVSHAYSHLVDFGTPVTIQGLEIRPGDLLFGDRHGVISIPAGIAAEIAAVADEQAEQERRVIELCRSEDVSLEALRAEVAHVR